LCIGSDCRTSWPSGGGGGLPSGSAGQTLRHDGTNWVANSLLYNDGTKVGIGTTSPTASLHVYNDADATGVSTVLKIEGTKTSGALRGIYLSVSGSATKYAFDGTASGAGANYGFRATASGGSTNYGLNALASGDSATNYAIYSSATGTGSTNWGLYVASGNAYIAGNLTVAGAKAFTQDYPNDPTKQIVYASLEGPEVGTYIRGTSFCNGKVTIDFPEHFKLVTSKEGLTAQLTPRGNFRMWIVDLDSGKLVVGCEKEGNFDYFVNGIRKGYEDFEVVKEK
jgi:hypothetical protein